MEKVKRNKGKTIIELNNLVIKTKGINRFKYNELRKKKKIKLYEIKKYLKK